MDDGSAPWQANGVTTEGEAIAIIAEELKLAPVGVGRAPGGVRFAARPADGSPEREAGAFVDPAKEVPDAAAALAGARDIVAERVAELAAVRKLVRDAFAKEGAITVKKTREHKD